MKRYRPDRLEILGLAIVGVGVIAALAFVSALLLGILALINLSAAYLPVAGGLLLVWLVGVSVASILSIFATRLDR